MLCKYSKKLIVIHKTDTKPSLTNEQRYGWTTHKELQIVKISKVKFNCINKEKCKISKNAILLYFNPPNKKKKIILSIYKNLIICMCTHIYC